MTLKVSAATGTVRVVTRLP